ncbi:MAG: hypothetical protein R3E53_19640 [Myxococcota bacterium]
MIRSLFGIAPRTPGEQVLPACTTRRGASAVEGLARHFDALLEHDRIGGPARTALVPDPELGALSRLEVVANAVLLVTAAIDTTAGLIGSAISCLLDRPEIVSRTKRARASRRRRRGDVALRASASLLYAHGGL